MIKKIKVPVQPGKYDHEFRLKDFRLEVQFVSNGDGMSVEADYRYPEGTVLETVSFKWDDELYCFVQEE